LVKIASTSSGSERAAISIGAPRPVWSPSSWRISPQSSATLPARGYSM
jgi:hypothetical protein